jgi:hypothetical protein
MAPMARERERRRREELVKLGFTGGETDQSVIGFWNLDSVVEPLNAQCLTAS